MVHYDELNETELNYLVSLVEEQTHKCAHETSNVSPNKHATDHFSQYWNMMDDTNAVKTLNTHEPTKPSSNHSNTPSFNRSTCCKTCKGDQLKVVDGYYVCQECGTLGEACIESEAEWRVFSKDENRNDSSRCGESSNSYLTVNDQAEGTVISCKWKESEKMRNARQYHKWNSCNANGRNLYVIFDELQRHAQKNGFNQMIIEDTKHLYKDTTDYHLFRGMNRKGLYAYCLYHTCKKKNVPRSIKEISKIFGLDPHVMTKGHTAFNKVLREHETIQDRKTEDTLSQQSKPTTKKHTSKKKSKKCSDGSKIKMLAKPIDFVDRFCSKLDISQQIVDDVRNITIEVCNKRLVSDNPSLITSACMLIVFTHHNIQLCSSDIQQVSNISHVTIDKCFKKLYVFYDALEPYMSK